MEKTRQAKDFAEENTEVNLYSEDGREELVENNELTPREEAFMSGWDQADEMPEDIEKEVE